MSDEITEELASAKYTVLYSALAGAQTNWAIRELILSVL